MRRASLAVASITLIAVLSGCSSMLGKLRRDLNDDPTYAQPTHGGLYPEGGYLSEDVPTEGHSPYLGHSERAPASAYTPGEKTGSWLEPGGNDSSARDPYRNAVTYGETESLDPGVARQYQRRPRARRSDFVDNAQDDGSLWASDGQTNYYFTKNRIRGVGDIVTITIEDQLIQDVAVELRNSLSQEELESELTLAQERIRARALGLPVPGEDKSDQIKTGAAAPARTPAGQAAAPGDAKEIRDATFQDINVRPQMKLEPGETMMAEIIERYPNGNYKVRATKRIMYRGGYRMLTMLGIAKAADVNDDDIVPSGRLYEYRLKVHR